MRALVTGGAGFIGSNLAVELENKGYEIIVIDRLSTGAAENLRGFQGKFIKGDVLDYDLHIPCDIIFHQAAITDPRHKNDFETVSENVEAFKRVVVAARDMRVPLVYASSASLYGNTSAPQRESGPFELLSAYAQSKLKCDKIAEILFDEMHIVGLRYFNVFGPREEYKGAPSSMIYHIIQTLNESKPLRLFEHGEQRRDHIYVDDIVRANLLALNAPSGVYNVGTGIGTRFDELAKTIMDAMGKQVEIEYIPNPYIGSYQNNTCANTELAESKLGFRAEISLREGIEKYLVWTRKNK